MPTNKNTRENACRMFVAQTLPLRTSRLSSRQTETRAYRRQSEVCDSVLPFERRNIHINFIGEVTTEDGEIKYP